MTVKEIDDKLEKTKEVKKKMLMTWKVVTKEYWREESIYRELNERRKDDLEKCEKLIQEISEEVQSIEEGKHPGYGAAENIPILELKTRRYIEKEKEYRDEGEMNSVKYWENVWKVVMEAKLGVDKVETEEAENSDNAEYEEEKRAEVESEDIGEVEEGEEENNEENKRVEKNEGEKCDEKSGKDCELEEHTREDHEVECIECHRKFTSEDEMKRHMWIQHEESEDEEYETDKTSAKCDKGDEDEDELEEHRIGKHEDVEEDELEEYRIGKQEDEDEDELEEHRIGKQEDEDEDELEKHRIGKHEDEDEDELEEHRIGKHEVNKKNNEEDECDIRESEVGIKEVVNNHEEGRHEDDVREVENLKIELEKVKENYGELLKSYQDYRKEIEGRVEKEKAEAAEVREK